MYCNNCGTQYDDGQAFCPNCGTPAENPAPNASPLQTPSNDDLKKKLPLICGAGVVLLLVIIILAAALSGGQKKAVKNYYKYFQKGQSEKLYKVVYPKDVFEELCDDAYDKDPDEIYEIQDAAFDALWDGLKSEGKVKFSYEIKNFESLNKLKKIDKDDIGVKNLDKFIDAMDDYYDDYDFDADKIKNAYAAEVKWELTVDGDKAAKDTDYLIIYKYRGKWYVEPNSMMTPSRIMNKLDDDDYEDVIEDVYDEIKALWD